MMDPLAASTLLATLVGLICNYRQEVGGRESLDHRTFMEWLENHRHEEIRNQIARNHELQAEIDGLLREDHQVMLAKLVGMEQMLAELLSRVPGFAGLAKAVHPEQELTTQSVEILAVLVDSGVRKIASLLSQSGRRYFLVGMPDGSQSELNFDEPRFADDDFRQLARLGLLHAAPYSKGNTTYQLTRSGNRYVAQVRSR